MIQLAANNVHMLVSEQWTLGEELKQMGIRMVKTSW